MKVSKRLFNKVAAGVKSAIDALRNRKATGKLETSYDYTKPALRGHMLQRWGKHRGTTGVDGKYRGPRLKRACGPGSLDFETLIARGIELGILDEKLVAMIDDHAQYTPFAQLPRSIREWHDRATTFESREAA
jgi:hypothetical protein